MKYTVEGFSQEAALSMRTTITENGNTKTIKLDIVDLTILRWIVDFYPNMKKTIIDGTEYAWVDYTAFIEDMPLLGLSNQSLYKRCIKMVQLGVLKHKTVRSKGTFSYYGFGPEYQRLVSRSNKTTNAPASTPTHATSTEHDPWASTTNATPEQLQLPVADTEPQPQPQPQPKKTRKTNSFDDIINSYTNDPQTKDLLGAWLQNRKAKRAAMTDRAIQGCIGKLDKLAQESHMSVNDYLDEVVCRGWSAFFPIENYRNNGYQQKPQQQSQQPHWDLTEEELRRQKEADDEWLKNCVF